MGWMGRVPILDCAGGTADPWRRRPMRASGADRGLVTAPPACADAPSPVPHPSFGASCAMDGGEGWEEAEWTQRKRAALACVYVYCTYRVPLITTLPYSTVQHRMHKPDARMYLMGKEGEPIITREECR